MEVRKIDGKISFEEIGSGQVFEVDNLLYMKFNKVFANSSSYNAICLRDAGIHKFSGDKCFKIVHGYFQETETEEQ